MVVAISDSPGTQCRWVRFGEGVVVVHNTKGWSTRVREMEGTNKTRDLHPLTRRYSIRLLPPSRFPSRTLQMCAQVSQIFLFHKY